MIRRSDLWCIKSEKEEDMVRLGRLPSGRTADQPIAAEADLLLSEGFIDPHFCVFSGGRKAFCRDFKQDVRAGESLF